MISHYTLYAVQSAEQRTVDLYLDRTDGLASGETLPPSDAKPTYYTALPMQKCGLFEKTGPLLRFPRDMWAVSYTHLTLPTN